MGHVSKEFTEINAAEFTHADTLADPQRTAGIKALNESDRPFITKINYNQYTQSLRHVVCNGVKVGRHAPPWSTA